MDHTAQINKAEKYRQEISAESICEVLTPEDISKTNAIARRMAVKLLALACPGSMPGNALLQQVPILERQYQNFEKSLKHVPMGGNMDAGSDDESDGPNDSDDPEVDEVLDDDKSDDSVEHGADFEATGDAPASAAIFDPFDDSWKSKKPGEPDPMEAVAAAAAQAHLAHGLAAGDPAALAAVLTPGDALRAILETELNRTGARLLQAERGSSNHTTGIGYPLDELECGSSKRSAAPQSHIGPGPPNRIAAFGSAPSWRYPVT